MSSTPRLPFDDAGDVEAPELPDGADRAEAVDPRRNVVLEASAGTGKTRVLVDRYVNLLKAGVDPRNILAITFTRKAAAEMRARIVQTVRRAAETGEIEKARWRELIDRLGDIGISTIDAFCLSLLREFPLEADLDPGFAMADETEVLRFEDEALDATLRIGRAMAAGDPAIGLVFAQLGDHRLRAGLAVLLERRLVARDALRRYLVRGPADVQPIDACRAAYARIRAVLAGVDGGIARFLSDGPRHHPKFALLASEIEGLLPDVKDAAGAEGARPASESPGATSGLAEDGEVQRIRGFFGRLRDHFLTKDGEPRTRWSYKAEHCDSAEAWRRHRERAAGLAPLVAAELARFDRDLNVVLSRGVWRIFEIALDQYRRTLAAHAVVDFPDALWRTLALLDQMDEFAQSRYLLEARYHHLLVDEFQDTSQAQWELVWKLVQTWAAGLGIGQDLPVQPSLFIVGDRKQSIYGFRDAEVTVLARAARQVAALRPDGDVRRTIRKSFRATAALLAFTNDVFVEVEKAAGRPDAFEYGPRDRFPVGPVDDAGDSPLGVITGSTPEEAAARVASEVERLLAAASVRDRHTGLPRPARPGDVGILFRSREGHQVFEAALEARGIPAYVYKGLGFFDAAEVKDVLALLRYFANPSSDLRAAALARSRLIRLSDPGLQHLGPRIADALRAPVAAAAMLGREDQAVLGQARAALTRWLSLVDRLPPADVLDLVLDESAYLCEIAGPRAAQARENLKKLRGVVRRVQNRGYATVARVAEHLDRLSTGDESNAAIDAVDAVNLMTVHAAKGLEFPVLFLVNLGKGSGGTRAPIRLTAGSDEVEPSVGIGELESDTDEDAAAREKEETKRLLYVAITRARERLFLSAVVAGDRFRPARGSLGEVLPATLQDAITRAAASQVPEVSWMGASRTHRLRVCRAASEPAAPARAPSDPGAADLAPVRDEGATQYETAVRGAPDPIASGAAVGGESAVATLAGKLVHRVLEHLPGGWDDDARALERRIRTSIAPMEALDGEATDRAVARAIELCAAIRRPSVRALLAGGVCAHEVPFSLQLDGREVASELEGGAIARAGSGASGSVRSGDRVVVRGTIDTLVERTDDVVVVEFKTGSARPEHEAQARVYMRAAAALFPGTTVRGVVVYPSAEVWLD